MKEPETTVDESRLASYLESALGVDVADVTVLNDGLNLVLAVSTDGTGPAYVVRRPTRLRDTYYMNAVEGEFGVLEHLTESDVPAPEPVHHCRDRSVLDGSFYVARYRPGSTIPLGTELPERFQHQSVRRRLAERLVDTLADIHVLDPAPFEAYCPTRTPRDQLDLALDRLDTIEHATGLDHDQLRQVGKRLHRQAPTTAEPALVHGDYRPGNVLVSGSSEPRITGVLDWETALLGDPLVDLGYLLLRWGETPTVELGPFESRFESHPDLDDVRAMNEGALAPFTTAPGSPGRGELVARYEARTGREFDQPGFYRAFAAFSLGLVWADLHRASIESMKHEDGDRDGDGDEEAARDPYGDFMALLASELCTRAEP